MIWHSGVRSSCTYREIYFYLSVVNVIACDVVLRYHAFWSLKALIYLSPYYLSSCSLCYQLLALLIQLQLCLICRHLSWLYSCWRILSSCNRCDHRCLYLSLLMRLNVFMWTRWADAFRACRVQSGGRCGGSVRVMVVAIVVRGRTHLLLIRII